MLIGALRAIGIFAVFCTLGAGSDAMAQVAWEPVMACMRIESAPLATKHVVRFNLE